MTSHSVAGAAGAAQPLSGRATRAGIGQTGAVFPDWLPVPGLDVLRSAFPVPTSPAGVLEAAVRMAASRLRGRVVTVRAADRDVPMTVLDLAVSGNTVGLAQGRVGGVLFAARDVAWPDLPVDRLTVECRDVRFAGPLSPRVVVGAVRVRASLSADAVVAAVSAADPRLSARFDGDRVWVRRRPWPGEVRVAPELDDGRLRVRPVAARLGRLAVGLSRPPVDIPLDLPQGMRITALEVTGDGVDVEAAAVDWRDRLSGTPVGELVSLLTTAATTFTVGLLPAPQGAADRGR